MSKESSLFSTRSHETPATIDILFFIWSKKVNLEFLYFIEIFILFKIKNALQWYFVNKIVLTYCEKKKCSGDSENLLKFKAEGREFEITRIILVTRTIYSNSERLEQFLKRNPF